MEYKVGPKGQVVIDKSIRDQLGVQPGSLAVQRLVDDHVEIYFLPPPHNRSLKGSLAKYAEGRPLPEAAFHEATERAWEEATLEEVRRWQERS